MEVDEDILILSNPVEKEDFRDLFEQHNHHPQYPVFNAELEFSDSDNGMGLDLLDNPLFQSQGSIFDLEDIEDWDEVDAEYLPPTFKEHPTPSYSKCIYLSFPP